MRCPYCRQALTELSPECPACRLSLQRANSILGPLPRLSPGVSDHTRALDKKEIRRLNRRIHLIESRFPQLRIQLLAHHFPGVHPFELHIFWLFNLAGISGDFEKAGDNHTVLIALDPIKNRSAIMVGYGLEPFLSESLLDGILDQAAAAWSEQAWAEGFDTALGALEPVLEAAVTDALKAYDLPARPPLPAPGSY